MRHARVVSGSFDPDVKPRNVSPFRDPARQLQVIAVADRAADRSHRAAERDSPPLTQNAGGQRARPPEAGAGGRRGRAPRRESSKQQAPYRADSERDDAERRPDQDKQRRQVEHQNDRRGPPTASHRESHAQSPIVEIDPTLQTQSRPDKAFARGAVTSRSPRTRFARRRGSRRARRRARKNPAGSRRRRCGAARRRLRGPDRTDPRPRGASPA